MHMRRWALGALLVTVGLVLTGCGEASPADQARDDARKKVEAAYRSIAGSPRIWPADALGRRANEAGLEVLAIDGKESGNGEPGVTMVVIVLGHGAKHEFYGRVTDPVDLPFCFKLTFATMHKPYPPEPVDCAGHGNGPITFPPLPPPPVEPSNDAIREALAGVPPTVDAVRAALDKLDLDQRIRVDIAARDGAVGVGMLALGSYNERLGCTMVRVAPDGTIEVWGPSRVQFQPGELSCTGTEATGHAGITPPH